MAFLHLLGQLRANPDGLPPGYENWVKLQRDLLKGGVEPDFQIVQVLDYPNTDLERDVDSDTSGET